jgi:ABC-type multidrug transport system fused ATPase/permease subunit
MQQFFKLAFASKRLYLGLGMNIIAFFALTIFNNLEMISLGLLTQNDVGFFTIFKKGSDGNTTINEINKTLKKVDHDSSGAISYEKIDRYQKNESSQSYLQKLYSFVKQVFGINSSFRLAFFVFSVVLLKSIALFLSRISTRFLSINIAASLKERYFSHLQKLKVQKFMHYDLGQLASRVVSDASQISLSINSLILNLFYHPICMLVSFSACIYLSHKLTLIVMVAIPSLFVPILWITKRVKRYTHHLQTTQDSFLSIIIDFLSGINTMKIFGMESYILKRFSYQNNKIQRLEKKINFYDLLTRPILHIITICCLGVILFTGLNVLGMSLTEVLIFCGLLHQFYEPIRKFADENANVQKGIVAASRLNEILDLECEDVMEGKKVQFKSEIHCSNLSFRYKDAWILRDVNLRIKRGQTVALVGATGSGKSTLLQLLSSLIEPSEGKIFMDGFDYHDLQKKSIRDVIAYVNQESFVFYDTVFSNIAFGQNFRLDEVQEAAKMAEIDEFIESLEMSYEHKLFEGGKDLSGGQKQRVCLARAFAKKSKILLLDEATSALDKNCERKIKDRLESIRGDVTQIIASHNISFIENADIIVFLQEGRICDQGTFEHLLKNCAPFKQLVESSKSNKRELQEF